MPSQPLQFFDAHAWARASLSKAPALQTSTLDVVAGFTFMWNLFEGLACHGSVSVSELGQVAKRIAASPLLTHDTVEHSLSFYRFRYLDGEQMQDRFYNLNFRQNDKQELVEAVIKGTETNLVSKLHALLIFAYRIRNNMFHGLKSVHIWDDQAQNISEAARILSVALEVLDTYIVERAHAT